MSRNVAHSCFGFPQVQWLFGQCLAILEMRGTEMTQAAHMAAIHAQQQQQQQHQHQHQHANAANTSVTSVHSSGASSPVFDASSAANPNLNLLQTLCQY